MLAQNHPYWVYWHKLYPVYKEVYPLMNKEFYSSEIKQILEKTKKPKILVSGAADEDTLKLIAEVMQQLKKNFEITLVDFYPEAISKNMDFAEKNNLRVYFILENILKFEIKKKFDLIITDGLLDFFNSEEKLLVLKKWRELLSKKGIILTTVPIKSNGEKNPFWQFFWIFVKAVKKLKNPLLALYFQYKIFSSIKKSNLKMSAFASEQELIDFCTKSSLKLQKLQFFHRYNHVNWNWFGCKLSK